MYNRESIEEQKRMSVQKALRDYSRGLTSPAGYYVLRYAQQGQLKSSVLFIQEILDFYKIGFDLREAAENQNYDHIESKYMNRMLPYMILRFAHTGKLEAK